MRFLTHSQLSRVAPAVFATQPDAGVSRHYNFVPTIAVVEALETQGWYPVRAQQTAVRDGARQDVARHLVRFRPEPDRQQILGDSVAELVLTNSHDRSAAFQLDLGVFRWVCENALITPLDEGSALLRIRHAGMAAETVVARVLALRQQIPRLAERIEGLQSTLMARAEAERFAKAALALRYGEDWQRVSPVTPTDVLTPRRSEDANAALWSVFNRVHENLFKGGLSGTSAKGRRTQTRAIRSVSEDVRLNLGLWRWLSRMFTLSAGTAREGNAMVLEPCDWNRTRDAVRNQRHQRALDTLSRFLGNGPLDYADFLHSALVCARLCPF